jgi:import receptor subunit TOM20
MNVKIKILSQPVGKKTLISENDFKEGDIIYTVFHLPLLCLQGLIFIQEMPVVSVLDPDLQASGKYCTHCLRAVEVETAVIPSSDHLSSVFCSKDCQSKCKIQSQNLLFGLEPVLPPQLNPLAFISGAQGSRDSAQKEFAAFIKSIQKSGPLLVARFTARQSLFSNAPLHIYSNN